MSEQIDDNQEYLNEVLTKTRTKLLDLTRRNRLLNFRETARDVAIVDEMPDQVFSHLVFDKKGFYFDPNAEDDERLPPGYEVDRTLPISAADTSEDRHFSDDRLRTPYRRGELERKLRKLYQEHRTIIQETGANSLALAIGFLEWIDTGPESKPSRSPMMLVPVHLSRIGGAGEAIYKLEFADEALNSNYSIGEKLKTSFGITLPHLEDEQKPEDYWSEIEAAIEHRKRQGWRVAREMVLGLFSFNKQIMWHDLDPSRWPAHSTLFDKDVLRRVLLGAQPGEQAPGQITTEYTHEDETEQERASTKLLVLDADSSQYSALVECLNQDAGLVIEGPPGTGKSQTITNLIALILAQGKSVLFLAEKMAALEVVFKRLDDLGLGDFCLQLHGLKTSKLELLDSLKKRMDLGAPKLNDVDTRRRQHSQAKKSLLRFSAQLLEQVGPENMELYRLPWKIEVLKAKLPSEFSVIDIEDVEGLSSEVFDLVRNRLDDLGKEWEAIPSDAKECWAGYHPQRVDEPTITEINQASSRTVSALDDLNSLLLGGMAPESAPTLHRVLSIAKLKPEQLLPLEESDDCREKIRSILHRADLHNAQTIVDRFASYLDKTSQINRVIDYSSDNADQHAHLLRSHCRELTNVVSQSLQIGELHRELESFSTVIEAFHKLDTAAAPIVSLLGGFARRLEDFGALGKKAEELSSGPLELSAHGHAAHTKRSTERTLRSAREHFDRLTRLAERFSSFHIHDIRSTEEIEHFCRVIRRCVGRVFRVFDSEYRSARRGIRQLMVRPSDFKCKPQLVEELHALCEFSKECDEYRENAGYRSALGSLFTGIRTDWTTLESLVFFSRNLSNTLGAETTAYILDSWDEHISTMEDCRDVLERSMEQIEEFKGTHGFPASMWDRPVGDIHSMLATWKAKIQSAINNICQPWCSSTSSLEEAGRIIDYFSAAKSLESQIQNTSGYDELVGENWDGQETPLSALNDAVRWLNSALEQPGLDLHLLRWLISSKSSIDQSVTDNLLEKALVLRSSIREQIAIMEKLGDVERTAWLGNSRVSLSSYRERMSACIETSIYLPLIARWRFSYDLVSKAGYRQFAELVSSGKVPGEMASNAFICSVYEQIFKKHVESNELLRTFGYSRYENLQKRFSELDRDLLSLNAAQIATQLCASNVPEGRGHGRVQHYSERRLIEHEAGKKRRHLPIRQLTTRAGNALQALKPCFLMSPLSVAQYLPPGEIEFDYVVMDEASQIKPEDALGAIARGRKAIIVGDPKQLPPTSFFDSAGSDDDESEETVVDDTESILDVALKQFPFRRLRWHYRSQHESLIQFSNEQFYEHDLIVFPSPRGDAREFGVHFNYVENPAYARGRNRPEAEMVVKHIARHFARSPEASLGIAAFNKRQAEEIQLLLDNARRHDPHLDALITNTESDEELFIKNLENVQGDERDVIFISTTYGPANPGDRVHQRFGPINSDIGWRRLNVIATRARQRVEIFSSMQPTDVLIDERTRRGPRSLRAYLEYAQTGSYKERGRRTGGAPDSDFEVAVGDVLQQLGYEWEPQVGVAGFFIDIGVVHPDRPGEYLLGVECDGAAYHLAKSVRDRDRLRQEILESKGWTIHRIWSTSWIDTRDAEIDRLRRALQKRLEEDRIHLPESKYAEEPEVDYQVDDRRTEAEERLQDADDSIRIALERFWQVNIKPLFPERANSILSEEMIRVLTARTPITKSEWQKAIPMEWRTKVNASEMVFLEDVLEVIEEFI